MRVKLTVQDNTKRMLKQFAELTGQGVEEGIKQMAQSSAIDLSRKVRPFGNTDAIGKRFQQSIRDQIGFASYAVATDQAFGAKTLEAGHRALRNRGSRKGSIRIRKMPKAPAVNEITDLQSFVAKRVGNAGIAKGAWIECAKKLGGKLTKVGKWITRHANSGRGTVAFMGRGLKTQIEMANNVTYIDQIQRAADMKMALVKGRENGLIRMKKQIEHRLKKLKQ